MTCRNCNVRHGDWCFGVKEPFKISDLDHECTEYPEKRDKPLIYAHIPGTEPIAKVVDVKEENGGLTATLEPVIKDSGDRTQFETGAVRDMREGKGRCDLMPLEVVSRYLGEDGFDPVIDYIVDFQKTNDTDCLYNALAYFDEGHWDNPYTMMLEVAKHFEEGAKKYGESNWRFGIPVHCYIDSAIRHYLKWLRGDEDEPHARAFVWNVMCCIWEVDYHKAAIKED